MSASVIDHRFFERQAAYSNIIHVGSLVGICVPVDKLRKHVRIAERICECWVESGDIGRYGDDLFKWIIDFFAFDVLSQDPDLRGFDELLCQREEDDGASGSSPPSGTVFLSGRHSTVRATTARARPSSAVGPGCSA